MNVPFRVWPTLAPWDVNVDEAPAPDPIPDLAFASPLTTPDQPSAATIVTYPVGGTVTRMRYTVPPDGSVIETAYRTFSGGTPDAWAGMTEFVFGGVHTAEVAADLTGQKVDFRVRTFDGEDNGSNWSEELNIAAMAVDNTAPGVCGISASFASGGSIGPSLAATAPDDLNVAYLTLTGSGAPTVNAIKPGETAGGWTGASGSRTYTASANASDGTAGPAATAKTDTGQASGGDNSRINVAWSDQAGQATIKWQASNDPNTGKLTLGGPGAPGQINVSPGATGSFTTSFGSGSHNWTARAFQADGTTPIGTNAASVSITI